MSCFPSISLALSTKWRAIFTCPCSISLQNAFWSDCFFVLNDFFSLVWIASHTENSSSFLCFHHSILLLKYLTCSLFFLSDGFWNSNGRNTWSMWIAAGSHLLLPLKTTYYISSIHQLFAVHYSLHFAGWQNWHRILSTMECVISKECRSKVWCLWEFIHIQGK